MFGSGRLGLKPADAAADAGESGRICLDAALLPDDIVGQGGLMAPRASAIGFLLLAVFGAASARGAVFDPTFGVGGIASDVTSEPGGNVVVDPGTGRIIVSDGFREATAFLPDGSPDRTFDIFVGYAAGAGPMIRQPLDGKLLFVGYDDGSNALRMQRYDADGNVDGSFGTGGVVTMPAENHPSAAIVQPDGRIVVCWTAASGGPYRGVIARFLGDGTPDPDFGTGGVQDTGVSGPRPYALLADDGGKVVVAGMTDDSAMGFLLARYDFDGSLDATFGTGGYVWTPITLASPGWMVRQSDHKMLVAARTVGPVVVIRYLADGALDTTYGSGGFAVFPQPETASIGLTDAVLDAADRLVGVTDQVILRLTVDGDLDRSFAPCGETLLRFGEPGFSPRLAQQPDGKLIVARGERVGIRPEPEMRLARFIAVAPTCMPAAPAGSRVRQASAGFSWKWKSSGTVVASDYGAPAADDTFLCLFDDSGPTIGSVVIDGTEWEPSRFGYRAGGDDPDLHGRLGAGVPGRAKITLRLSGERRFMTQYPETPYGFPFTLRLDRVGAPFCWEAHFTTAVRNEIGSVSAKSD
jgi:uncharacterized delta-60 repeat protein